MNRKLFTIAAIVAFAIAAVACSKSSPSKPPAANTNANASAKASTPTTTKSAEVKVAKAGEKPPETPKVAIPESKKVPVPQDWDTYYDSEKGYQFAVPAGTESNQQTVSGVDVFVATVPQPAKVAVMVVAFKNAKLTKDDLLEKVTSILAGVGETNIKVGTVQEISEDYDLAEVTSTDAHGAVTRTKVLIATDVTDNYLVLVGSPESDFKANEHIVDGIWGSFAMYSGGASGNS